MRWVVQPHASAPDVLVGVETDVPAPAGEAGTIAGDAAVRFNIRDFADPSRTPRLTALWVSTATADPAMAQLLGGLPDAVRDLLVAGVERPATVSTDDGVGGALLELAAPAVADELDRLFSLDAHGVPTLPAWTDAGEAVYGEHEGGPHPAAAVRDGTTWFPVLWPGLTDDTVRALASPWMRTTIDGGRIEVELELSEAPPEPLILRVVHDDDRPDTVAAVAVRDGRALVERDDLPGSFRVEVVDTTLRPELSRGEYQRAIARQWGTTAVACQRAGLLTGAEDLVERGNAWWRRCVEAYAIESAERGVDSAEAEEANDAIVVPGRPGADEG